jgi:recombination protein RecA
VFFGNPETTTGGMALKFYSSVRIELKRAAQIKMGENTVGNRVKVKIVKNKVAPPFKSAEFDIMYNEGISLSGDVLDLGIKYNLIKKQATTFYYNDLKLAAGREAAKTFLKADKKLMRQIAKEIWQKVREEEN